MSTTYLGHHGLAEALGVTREAVYQWRRRHPDDDAHPFPAPDVLVDGNPGWQADRIEEVVRWRQGLPGRGAGGGRPPASRRSYLAAAAARGFDTAEAQRMVEVLIEEHPELSEREVHAWLVDAWRD